MVVTLSITRYRRRNIFFAFLSMVIFRFPLWKNRKISFYKLMGSGRNGTFDKTPDLQQWAVLLVWNNKNDAEDFLRNSFIHSYWKKFSQEQMHIFLEPLEYHGKWDGKQVFGAAKRNEEHQGMIAVLTRATIRLQKLSSFWKHVDPVASQMGTAKGFITSFGIGEIPWIKQATFSIWENRDDMKAFAYKMKEHAEVIRKTRTEKWYSEDLFARFKVTESRGTLNGRNSIAERLTR